MCFGLFIFEIFKYERNNNKKNLFAKQTRHTKFINLINDPKG